MSSKEREQRDRHIREFLSNPSQGHCIPIYSLQNDAKIQKKYMFYYLPLAYKRKRAKGYRVEKPFTWSGQFPGAIKNTGNFFNRFSGNSRET